MQKSALDTIAETSESIECNQSESSIFAIIGTYQVATHQKLGKSLSLKSGQICLFLRRNFRRDTPRTPRMKTFHANMICFSLLFRKYVVYRSRHTSLLERCISNIRMLTIRRG